MFYEVISIINKKKTLFKGFIRGDPWAPSLTKQNLNRMQNREVIALKKKRTFFKDVTRGDPWAASHTNQNLNRTQNHEANTAARTQYMAWVV
jgi:hypothetical protein